MAMNKLFTVGLGGIVLVVHWMPAIAQPLKFDPVEFDAAPLPYMSSDRRLGSRDSARSHGRRRLRDQTPGTLRGKGERSRPRGRQGRPTAGTAGRLAITARRMGEKTSGSITLAGLYGATMCGKAHFGNQRFLKSG
jgi:hypothetical protein